MDFNFFESFPSDNFKYRIKILKDIKFFFFFARRKKKEEMEVLDLKRTFYRKISKH